MRIAIIGLTCAVVFGLSGCGKIPTWGELTGGSKPAEPEANPTPAPPVVQQVVQPPPPSAQEIVAKFKTLKPSEINDSAITQLTSLSEGLNEITEINADFSTVTSAAFASISKLSKLRQLRLSSTRVTNEACEKIAELPALEVLILSDTVVDDVGVAALSRLSNLKSLELSRCHLTRAGFQAIGAFPALEYLEIRRTNLDDVSLDLVCNAKTLVSLRLSNNPITDQGLDALGKLPGIEVLEFNETGIHGWGLAHAQKRGGGKNLKELSLFKCPLDGMGAKAIGNFKSVEKLVLGEIPQLDDEGLMTMVRGMKNLKYLNCSKTPSLFGTLGFKALLGSKDLEELHIGECSRIGDDAVPFIKKMKNLKILRVHGTSISARGMAELALALPDTKIN
ncbi:ribonuclease inhibitor [Schlesneria paludicola]|uniref:ribonuclease inhibitor n=1 Tax=Schlesneria paludicola TaxID=360056 RepID=UPI00029A9D2C|nr:ribonuclease inhibitor [Schlesneria paludicola]